MRDVSTPFNCLYAVREKYPAFRVDLTELFSAGLARKGHTIDWHMQADTAGPTRWVGTSDAERIFVGRAFGGKGLLTRVFNLLAGVRHDLRLYRQVFARDYDFVQVRDKIFAGLVAMLAAKARGIPFFYWMSFPYPEADHYRAGNAELRVSVSWRCFYRLRGTLTDWLLYRVVLPRAAHIFVQSQRMKEDVAARGIASERMTAVPMGINLDQVAAHAARPLQSTPRSHPLLVYTGAMTRVRRIDFLIDMLKRVHTHVPDAELLLVGEGLPRDMDFLRSEAERLGVAERVRFAGFVPMEQAWNFIRDADVCLSPFTPNPILDSTTPTKVIEYMAFNKVVVANHHPDQGKLLDESGAGFAVAYDPQAFADAVVILLQQPQRALAMAARGLDYVRSHRSYAAMTVALEARYLELLGRQPAVQLVGATSV